MKALVRRSLDCLPDRFSYWAYLSYDSARHLMFGPSPEARKVNRLFGIDSTAPVVCTGPFCGMRYVRRACGSAYAPKVLGTYEREVWGALELLMRRRPGLVVDIGCAEGYYAIGTAMKLREAQVVAFDSDARARHACRLLARLNGVSERVRIHGCCNTSRLSAVLRAWPGSSVILCDCEGAEDELLLPESVPELIRCAMLVEVHEFLCPGVSDRLLMRFGGTHAITQVDCRSPATSDLPFEYSGVSDEALVLLRERSVAMHWFLMLPKSKPGN